MSHCRPALLALALALPACGGAQPVEAIWAMPTMEDGQPAGDGRSVPFAYAEARGISGGDQTDVYEDDAHPGDLPETMLSTAGNFWMTDEAQARDKAKSSGRGLLIDFYAEWCDGCRYLEGDTLRDYEVRVAILERYVPLRVDVTEETFVTRELLERYKVMTLPAIVLIDPQGNERDRVEAYIPAHAMLERLGDARTARGR